MHCRYGLYLKDTNFRPPLIVHVPIKRLTKRKVQVGFTRLLCLGNVIKNIIWVSKIWDSGWT